MLAYACGWPHAVCYNADAACCAPKTAHAGTILPLSGQAVLRLRCNTHTGTKQCLHRRNPAREANGFSCLVAGMRRKSVVSYTRVG